MLGVRIWQTERTLLRLEDLFEAKETYPIGTIKQYGPVHLYVKTGGKKPWVYYGTLGTEKANAAIQAGGVLVKDSKAVGAATQENQKKFGLPHPFKGQKIPALVPGVPVYPPGEEPPGMKPEFQGVPPKAGVAPVKPETPAVAPASPPMSGGVVVTPTTPLYDPAMKAQKDKADTFKKALYQTLGVTPPDMLDFLKKKDAESVGVSALAAMQSVIQKFGQKTDFTQIMADFQLAHDLVVAGSAADALANINNSLSNLNPQQIELFLSFHGKDFDKKVMAFAGSLGVPLVGGGVSVATPATPPPPAKKHKHSVPAGGSVGLSAAPTPPPPPTVGVQPPGGKTKLTVTGDALTYLPLVLKAIVDHGSADDYEKSVSDPAKLPGLFGKDWKKLAQLGSTVKSYGSSAAMIDASKNDDDLTKSWAEEYGDDWEQWAKNVEGALGGSYAELPAEAKPQESEVTAKKKKGKKAAAAAAAAAVTGLGGVGPAPTLPSVPLAGAAFGGAGSLPGAESLSNPTSGKSMGGAGEKTIYEGPNGKKYLFKKATLKGSGAHAKPYAAEVQAAFSRVAKLIKPEHLEVGVAKIGGSVGTLQPLITGATNLVGVSPAELSDQEKLDVASEHLLDWLGSQHDSFDANFLRVNGHIVGVDKEQGFRFLGTDSLSTGYKPNSDHHGEKPPYYNQFWKDWEDGKFNFNPESLSPYVDQIDKLNTDAYVENYRPYAESMFPGKAAAQEDLLDQIRQRKLHVRKDFEKFLTGLYHKRFATGGMGGFSFAGGWDSGVDAGPTKKKIKTSAKEEAKKRGIVEKPFVNPDKSIDDTKITLRVPKTETKEVLEKFAKEFGLKPFGVVTGSNNHLMFLDRKAYEAAKGEFEIEVESPSKGASVQPDNPYYFPDNPKVASKPITANAGEVKKLHELHLSRHGKRFTSDGGAVEGMCAKAKKFVGSDGKPYYLFHFKLRKSTWSGLKSKGTSSSFSFPHGKYDASQDAIVETGGHVDSVPTRQWSTQGGSELHIATGSDKYAYMGSVYARVRPKPGQTPAEALEEVLDQVKHGFSKDVLRNSTPEEQELARLGKLFWVLDPHGSDALDDAGESGRTIPALKAKLKALGVKDEDLETIEEQEVLPGYSTHVMKGRWKKLAKGKLRFLEHGISGVDDLMSVLQTGLLGIHERNLHGIEHTGASYPSDVGSGSGDGVLVQPVCESGLKSPITSQGWSKSYQAILAPDVMDRLDTYTHPGDRFGACKRGDQRWEKREPDDDQFAKLAGHHNSGAETSFRRGVQLDKILRITVQNTPTRNDLIKVAKKRGIQEVNGVPIDDFIVVADDTVTMKDIYEKYVKPMGY